MWYYLNNWCKKNSLSQRTYDEILWFLSVWCLRLTEKKTKSCGSDELLFIKCILINGWSNQLLIKLILFFLKKKGKHHYAWIISSLNRTQLGLIQWRFYFTHSFSLHLFHINKCLSITKTQNTGHLQDKINKYNVAKIVHLFIQLNHSNKLNLVCIVQIINSQLSIIISS